jgi:diguanylate cyclase (GGDEF)-like protein/PAS domain S-box-containing protein
MSKERIWHRNEIVSRRVERGPSQNQPIYRELIEGLNDVFFNVDPTGRISYISPSITSISGYSSEEIIGKNFFDFVKQEERDQFGQQMQQTLSKGNSIGEFSLTLKDNSARFMRASSKCVIKNGNVVSICGIMSDITERKQTENDLRESREKFIKAFQNSPYAITITNIEDGEFIEVNDAFTTITGFCREELTVKSSIGMNLWVNINDRKQVVEDIQKGILIKNREYKFKKKEGEIITGLYSAQMIHLNTKPFILSSIDDITERKLAEKKILELSFNDPLTGIYNRRFLQEELKRLNKKRRLPLSIMTLDIDGLKIINDTYGHLQGDRHLKKAANILTKICRSDDIIARMGGDEFTILLPNTSREDAKEIANRLTEECQKTNRRISLSFSIGIATKTEVSQKINHVMKEADDNMYLKKKKKKPSPLI